MAQMKPTVKKGNLKSSTKKTEKDPKRKLKLAPERAPAIRSRQLARITRAFPGSCGGGGGAGARIDGRE